MFNQSHMAQLWINYCLNHMHLTENLNYTSILFEAKQMPLDIEPYTICGGHSIYKVTRKRVSGQGAGYRRAVKTETTRRVCPQ